MERCVRIDELVRRRRRLRQEGLRIGFVPTMGALHEGHSALVRVAREHADHVVVSIFVNPKQFGPAEDLARYPRDLEGDAERLEREGCDTLFAPEAEAMYPPGFETRVSVPETASGLCGAQRPGHFDGVATVVAKLFNIVAPDVAVFGEKDFQQLAVIRRMVADLAFELEIVGVPTVREPDGLALSSRNVYLSPEERARALSLGNGLSAARAAHAAGERRPGVLIAAARAPMAAARVEPEYLELRSFDDLRPVERADGPCVLLVAAKIGGTRLIDNVILGRP